MTLPDDTMTDAEIDAFLTGQLDPERRFAVADHLSRDPARAARAMADLRMLEGLRLALSQTDTPPPPPLARTARRLSRRLGRPSPWPLRAAAAVACLAAGWGGHDLWADAARMRAADSLRPLAETALDARAAVELRRSLAMAPAMVDADRIAARLGLELPALPSDWHVRDAQVVATPDQPGLAVVIDTPDMGEIMLLSFPNPDGGAERPPQAFDHRGTAVAVFEHGDAAYVLLDAIGGVRAEISLEAERLLRRMN